jgi:hypothetical protein
MLVALAVLLPRRWYPTGDMAQAELHVRGIWRHLPLVGAAGRIVSDTGVVGSHPGPSLWFAMYPLYLLFGRTSSGMLAGAASVSMAAAGIALWVALRRGGMLLAATVTLTLAVLIRASGPDVFTEPWNPWLGFVPFAAFLLALWAAVLGDRVLWPITVVLGCHAVQCHTGYIVITVGLLGVGVVWGLARSRGVAGRTASTLRWLAIAAGAGAVMWVLPLVDQVTRTPGNISILVQHFGSPSEPYLPRRLAAEAFLQQTSLFGPWLTGASNTVSVRWAGVAGFALLWAVGAALASRRRADAELVAHGLLLVGVLITAVSISRIFGQYFEYTVRWAWLIVAGVVMTSLVSIGRWAVEGSAPRSRWAVDGSARGRLAVAGTAPRWRSLSSFAVGSLALAAAVSVVASVQFGRDAGVAGEGDGKLVGGLVGGVEAALVEGDRYLLRWWDPAGLGGPGFGLQLELERRGHVVGVDREFAAASLPHRVLPEDRADAVLYLVVGGKLDEVRSTPGLRELAWFDPRTPGERIRSDELRAFLERRLAEIGRPDLVEALDAQYGQARLIFADPPLPPDIFAAAEEFVDLRQPGAVFLAAPGTPVPPLA